MNISISTIQLFNAALAVSVAWHIGKAFGFFLIEGLKVVLSQKKRKRK